MPRPPAPLLRAASWIAALWLLLASGGLLAAPPHLELEVELDPATRRLQASARLTSARIPGFALHPGLTISHASVDGVAVAPAELARLPPAAAARTFAIDYAGTLPPLPAGGSERTSANPASLYADPQGSYLAAGSWYPDPGEPFTYRLKLKLPRGQKGLVPGRQLRVHEADDHWAAEYAHAHPAEGIWLMAGPYQVTQQSAPLDDGSRVTVRTWFHPELARLAPGYLQDSARYLQRYSRAIGPYPFGDFSIVSSPLSHGLGLPGLTYLGRDVLRLPFIRATSLGHEVLHSWWGQGVIPDWGSGNWSEGLTTFQADYAYREDQGAEAARAMRLEWLRDLMAVAPADETPLAGFTARHHGISSVVGYAKAAMLFFMLRDEIGAPAFDQGLRSFWQRHRFRVAAWKDLQQVFSETSGRDLSSFFHQWTQRPASPVLQLARGEAGRLRVVQQGEPFELLVPLRVQMLSGETRDIAVRVRGRETVVDLAAHGLSGAASVTLDPDLRLWRRLDPESVPPILRETFIAPRAQLHVAADGAQWSAAGKALARRVLDAEPLPVAADGLAAEPQVPALVVGDRAGVTRLLTRMGLRGLPQEILADGADPAGGALRGSARAWTARTALGKPLVFVIADSPEALAATQRALPHYGRQSWLVFENGRVVDRGTWPAVMPSLALR